MISIFPWVREEKFTEHLNEDAKIHQTVIDAVDRWDARIAAIEPSVLSQEMREAIAEEFKNREFWTELRKKVAAWGVVVSVLVGIAAGVHEMWADIRSTALVTSLFGHAPQALPAQEQATLPAAGATPKPAETPMHGGAK